jgi:hypothetical protein
MVIKEKYDAPFGDAPDLRLSLIKRWGIIKMSREQSVAEHSFNVAVITKKLCEMFGKDGILEGVVYNDLIAEAIFHDCCEVFTGDIPSVVKEPSPCHCHPIVKLADLIESFVFFRDNCVDRDAVHRWIDFNLRSSIEKLCKKFGYNHSQIITFMGRIDL